MASSIDLFERLSQLTDALFERVAYLAKVDRSLFAPRTALLADRVLGLSELAKHDTALADRLSDALDEHAPWTRAQPDSPLPSLSADADVAIAAWLRHGRRVHARMPVLGPRAGARSVPRAALLPREEPWSVVAVEDLFVELTMETRAGRFGARDDHGHDDDHAADTDHTAESHGPAAADGHPDDDRAHAEPRDTPDHGSTRVTLDQAIARVAIRGPLRMALLGEPGAGKTTLLRHLFGRLAPPPLATAGTTPLVIDPPPPALDGLRPVWLTFRAIAAMVAPRSSAPTGVTLADVVRHVHREHAAAADAVLADGAILFLLDGLDEVGDADDRVATSNWLLHQVERWERAAFMVTCRRTQWQETPGLARSFAPVSVEGLTPALQRQFVHRWFRVAAELDEAAADRAAAGLLRDCSSRHGPTTVASRRWCATR